MNRANIGLGANLGDAAGTLAIARARLTQVGRIAASSAIYRTPAWGVTNQPDFVNAVVALDTALAPVELLAALKSIEQELGRVATFRWGPRAIDLDILTYGDVRLDTPLISLPHPRLRERAFVLVPLAEIDPAYAAARDALPVAERAPVERIGTFEGEGAQQ